MNTTNNGQKQASVRIRNRYLVLELLRRSGELTVANIAEEINLSKTTIWKIIDHLLKLDLIVPCGKGESSEEGGKKPELYRFNEKFGYVISMTIWGDSIHLALTDAGAGIFYKEIVYIQNNEHLEKVVSIIASFIKEWQDPENMVQEGARLLGVVVAAPGVVDWEKGIVITSSRFNSWQILSPFKELILEQTELKAPFYIDNYNRFHVFAEKTIGQVKDKNHILCTIANKDGIGAGIIADGKLERGPQFLTGEIGHMCLELEDSEVCRCGGTGCFEQLTSISRILARAEERKVEFPESELAEGKISLQKIFDASCRGDRFARILLDPVIDYYAMALYNANLVFNAETIIIAGDYSNAGPYFLDELREKMENRGFLRIKKHFDIRYSVFDEEGSLRGGACYVINDYFENFFE